MQTFVFNKNKPKITPNGTNLRWELLSGQKMFKYAEFDIAYEKSLPCVKEILSTCPFVGGFKHKLVDVKLHKLAEGECPCLFGWHLDGHPNPFKYEKPAIYHLFLIGPEHSRTLFLDAPVELDVIDDEPKKVNDSYVQQLSVIKPPYHHAPESSWVTFTSEDFHSGPIVTTAANRLLVRIAETNWIEPRNAEVKEAFVQKPKNV